MKKGEMGIGTLILFIAMILVAAVAAGVLISTAMGLQSKALMTGKRTKDKVSTQIMPVVITAEDGSTGNDLEYFYVQVQLAPGSEPIKYSEMVVVMSTKNDTKEMTLNNTATNCSSSDPSGWTVGKYGVVELLSDGDENYLSRGEVARICFKYSRSIKEDEGAVLQLVPKSGSPVILDLVMPSIINQKTVVLYP
ncbi:MAG: archaellin/type IV pilin N-terminal domain-containing protein [Candidatus Woesearchaeota archaeon]